MAKRTTRTRSKQTATGYSGKPLVEKLGLKQGHRVTLLGEPDGFEKKLAPIPQRVTLARSLRSKSPADAVVCFVTGLQELDDRLGSLQGRVAQNGMIWIAWPKKVSGVPSDVSEDRVREAAIRLGLVDVKVCAIDETWSGLKLVMRLKLRELKRNASH